MSNEQPTPDAIMQLTRAYAGSKALVSAIELGPFTTLADRPLTGQVLRAKLGLGSYWRCGTGDLAYSTVAYSDPGAVSH